jgi:universal stress protein A
MKDCKIILVAIDFSDSSENAFQVALGMAQTYDAHLIVLHVINEPVDLRGFYVPHISFEKLEGEITDGANKLMESFCHKNLKDYPDHECLIVTGLPYEQVINQAIEHAADMIVLGTHGRTGLDHVLFGSTAEKVVRKSPLPVLTVRLEDES